MTAPNIPLQPPSDAIESNKEMSNYDHSIDVGLDEDLKNGMTANYPAMNFYGTLWFSEGKFYCLIMRHHQDVETIEATILEEIMDLACKRYGDE